MFDIFFVSDKKIQGQIKISACNYFVRSVSKHWGVKPALYSMVYMDNWELSTSIILLPIKKRDESELDGFSVWF